MPLPESAGVGTIEGEFLVGTSGVPDSGSVTFKPNLRRVSIDDVTVSIPDVIATLDEDGKITAELIATDDVDHNPQGLMYLAYFNLAGGPQWPVWVACPGGVVSNLEDVIVRAVGPVCSVVRGPRGADGMANFEVVDVLPDPEDMIAGTWYVVAP